MTNLMIQPIVLTALATAGVVAPASAAAVARAPTPAGPQPPNCPLFAAGPPVNHPLRLADGARVIVRDPYGGLLPRNRLFFSFSVQRPGGGAPSGVAMVAWALDGQIKRSDPTPPFAWAGSSGSNRRMPAGDHTMTVTVTPTGGGTPASVSFRLTATDCQPAHTFSSIEEILDQRPQNGSSLCATSSLESDSGPTMHAVAFRSSDVNARITHAMRNRVAGTLRISHGNSVRPTTTTLRVPRTGTTLLTRGRLRVVLHPGAQPFLTVDGLPARTREVTVRLIRAGGRKLLAARRVGHNRCRYATSADISGPLGLVRADGGVTSGLCRFSH